MEYICTSYSMPELYLRHFLRHPDTCPASRTDPNSVQNLLPNPSPLERLKYTDAEFNSTSVKDFPVPEPVVVNTGPYTVTFAFHCALSAFLKSNSYRIYFETRFSTLSIAFLAVCWLISPSGAYPSKYNLFSASWTATTAVFLFATPAGTLTTYELRSKSSSRIVPIPIKQTCPTC